MSDIYGDETDGLNTPGVFGNIGAPTWSAPAAYQAPTPYQATTYQAPSYQAPAEFSYGLDKYQASPGYQWQQDESRRAVEAKGSAIGGLRTGAALKELQDRAQQIAYQDYTGERAFAAGRYDTDRNFGRSTFENDRGFGRGTYENDRSYGRSTYEDDRNFGRSAYTEDRGFDRGNYENDRNYLTNRYDQHTGDLFNYTALGANAVTGTANAALGLGNNNAAGAVATGDARAGNALQQGNIWSGVAGDLGGIAANYLTGYK